MDLLDALIQIVAPIHVPIINSFLLVCSSLKVYIFIILVQQRLSCHLKELFCG